jgi:hypothetical protein
MENVETAVAFTFALAVVFFAPVLVWLTLIVGLHQLVRDKIRDSHLVKMLWPISPRGSERST